VAQKCIIKQNVISQQPTEISLSKFQDLKGEDFQLKKTAKI